MGESTLSLAPAAGSIFDVTPFEGPLHPWLQYHLCLILDHEGGSTLDLDPAQDPIFVLYLLRVHSISDLQSHLCLTLDHRWGVNSASGSSSGSIFMLHLFMDLLHPQTPVPSMSHLRSWGGSTPSMSYKINFCVVPFEGLLHHHL